MISFERLGITPPRLIWAGCLVTLLYAAFSLGTYHPDEHFQILEYAHMKLFGTPTPDHLPWEYLLQMRPGIQPFVAWAVGKGLLAAGIYSPFAVVFVLQLLSGALSAAALLFFYRTVRDDLRDENARCWFLLLGFFLWYLAYLHVHFNAEMISGNLLLLLAALTMRCHRAVGRREFGRGVLLGMTAGLTFAVRFQMGFALLGYGIWLLVFHRRRKLYAGMVPGVLVVLALGMLTDRWLYGEWTLTPVNYLRENILNENMLKFGTSPWWYYFTEPFTEGGYVYGPLALVAAVWFFWRRPRHVVTWMLVPFLLAFESRKPQARELVVIAVLSALAVAARVVIPLPHFKAIFAVIMLSGIAFGPEAGFMVGAVSALASNFFYGQGAYTPWQMFAYGAGGMLAGFLFAKNRLPKKPVAMGIFGFLAVLLFVGPLLDTCTVFLTLPVINAQTAWPLYVSGFPVNLSQGICTLLTMLIFGKPLLEKLDRVKLQYGMGEDDGV